MYLKHIEEINDSEFDHILWTLHTLELDPDFALSYERLNKIADDLIARKSNINVGILPHYHRKGQTKPNRETFPGQASHRHRPWESNENDKNFKDRF